MKTRSFTFTLFLRLLPERLQRCIQQRQLLVAALDGVPGDVDLEVTDDQPLLGLLDDALLLDRALESVIGNLRRLNNS